MGEYEPDDSREVTQVDHQAPGEPARTGPREDAARAEAKKREPANDDRMAIENDTGVPRPKYDQYAVNDPQSLDKDGRGRNGDEKVGRAGDEV